MGNPRLPLASEQLWGAHLPLPAVETGGPDSTHWPPLDSESPVVPPWPCPPATFLTLVIVCRRRPLCRLTYLLTEAQETSGERNPPAATKTLSLA